jgi:hypothetical protein
MRRTLGARLMERGLMHLPGNLRLLVLALVVLSLATMLAIAITPMPGTTLTATSIKHAATLTMSTNKILCS